MAVITTAHDDDDRADVRQAIGRVGITTRYHGKDAPETRAARRDLVAATLEQQVRGHVGSPTRERLLPAQRARLRRLVDSL